MGMGYMVKICINQKFDHYTSGKENYYDILNRVRHRHFDPFEDWWEHKIISDKWQWKKHKITSITFLFIRKSKKMRYIKCVISLKIKNCKVISKNELVPHLKFEKSDPQYKNTVHIKLHN